MPEETVKGRTILVTGGAGFIGSHTCQALLRSGYDVAAVDNFSDFYDPRQKQGNIREVEETALTEGRRFQLYEGDIRDIRFLEKVFPDSKPDAAIHLAAYAGVRPSINDPVLYTQVNVDGTANLLECLRKQGVRRLLFASSSSVYGSGGREPFSESNPADKPISPYAATKRAGELLCYTYHALYGINAACLRFFTVYGPRQRPDLAIHKFTKLILEGKPVPFYGCGLSKRDYTFVSDTVDGIMKALEWTDGGHDRFDVFNLGNSNTVSLNRMIETLEQCLGRKAILDRLPDQPGDVDFTCADLSHSERVLGYRPHTDFKTGIKVFSEWFLRQGDS